MKNFINDVKFFILCIPFIIYLTILLTVCKIFNIKIED